MHSVFVHSDERGITLETPQYEDLVYGILGAIPPSSYCVDTFLNRVVPTGQILIVEYFLLPEI